MLLSVLTNRSQNSHVNFCHAAVQINLSYLKKDFDYTKVKGAKCEYNMRIQISGFKSRSNKGKGKKIR